MTIEAAWIVVSLNIKKLESDHNGDCKILLANTFKLWGSGWRMEAGRRAVHGMENTSKCCVEEYWLPLCWRGLLLQSPTTVLKSNVAGIIIKLLNWNIYFWTCKLEGKYLVEVMYMEYSTINWNVMATVVTAESKITWNNSISNSLMNMYNGKIERPFNCTVL